MDQILSQIFVDDFTLYLGNKGDKNLYIYQVFILLITPVFHLLLRIILSLQIGEGREVLRPHLENCWPGECPWWEKLELQIHRSMYFPVFACSQTLLCPQLSRISFLLTASLIPSSPSCGTWPIRLNVYIWGHVK